MKLWLQGSKVIILDVPLLFETKLDRWTKPVVVVWVNSDTQLERLVRRDGISEGQAQDRINAQAALDWKRSKADIVIDNSGSLEWTIEQVNNAFIQVMKPLTWTEFWLSRSGAICTLVSVVIGVLVGRYVFNLLKVASYH